jgi:hypothetical protein
VSGNETSPAAAGYFSTAANTVEVVSTAELLLFLTPAGGRPGFLGDEGLLFPSEKDRNDVFSSRDHLLTVGLLIHYYFGKSK